jgi:hypothetical protein
MPSVVDEETDAVKRIHSLKGRGAMTYTAYTQNANRQEPKQNYGAEGLPIFSVLHF